MQNLNLKQEFERQLSHAQKEAVRRAKASMDQVIHEAMFKKTARSGPTIRAVAKAGASELDIFVQEVEQLVSEFSQVDLPTSEMMEGAKIAVVQFPLQLVELDSIRRFGEYIPHLAIKRDILRVMAPSIQNASMRTQKLKIGILKNPPIRIDQSINQTVFGDNNGSVQAGGNNSAFLEKSTLDTDLILEALDRLKLLLETIQESNASASDALVDVQNIKNELSKQKPSKSTLKSALEGIQRISETAAGGALGQQLAMVATEIARLLP